MAIDYPDVIGEYISAPQRFQVDGLQFAGRFDPPQIRAGQTTYFYLYVQSMIDAPLKATLQLVLPQSGRFRGQPLLKTQKTELDLELAMAEVGRWVIPFTTTDKVVDGKVSLGLEIKVDQPGRTNQIRHPRSKPIKVPYLDDLSGLDLITVLGAHYGVKNGKKTTYELTLSSRPGEATERPNLEPNYQQLWNLESVEVLHQAQHEVNEGRVQIVDDLQVEPLFTALYAESTERFADSGLTLRVGEAIAIGKLLTYTAHFFLGQGPLQNGLLCPIWERALVNELSTANTLNVVKIAGYRHLIRLASALSFGMATQTAGKNLWSLRERQQLGDFIASALEEGSTMPADFLYLPLMLGALKIATKVRLPDEDVTHTLQLIQAARQARPEVLVDEDMANADKLFDVMLGQAINEV